MIDPKGVIGPAILDLPRFILNEIDTEHEKSDYEHIKDVIQLICDKFRYPSEDVKKSFFVEVILANVWNIEDHEEIDENQIKIAKQIDMHLRK